MGLKKEEKRSYTLTSFFIFYLALKFTFEAELYRF